MPKADDVRQALVNAGLSVKEEKELQHESRQFRLDNGAVVNVYSTGKVQVQGKHSDVVEQALADHLGENVGQGPGNRVFVVYGRDTAAKAALEAMLRRWGVDPVFLDQIPAEGFTLIEKLEQYMANTHFAVVLATADDVAIADDGETREYRARQNVVLELGMMLAKLGRSCVAILLENKVGMKKPSDIDGLEYIAFESAVKDADVGLAKMMRNRGYNIDVAKL